MYPKGVKTMFIDANDEKWSYEEVKSVLHKEPLSVCFMDRFGNSFLNRVKECIGKPIMLSLAIPFDCFLEGNGKEQHDRRKGFLLVNNFMGMVYGYGLMEKLKNDLIPLITKKDLKYLYKKGILCFFQYGSVYIEFTKNIWIEKENLENGSDHPFLKGFAKNPKRFVYDFQNRRPQRFCEDSSEMAKEFQLEKRYPAKIVDILRTIQSKGVPFGISESDTCLYGLKIHITQKDWLSIMQEVKKRMYMKQMVKKDVGNTCWVLEKMPVFSQDGISYIESWQCEWLQIPYVEIQYIKQTP